jgi:uncharacterized cofD-like protein
MKKKKKVVLIGGGVSSSTFTRALKDLPIDLVTIVSAFDDGGSTGAIRRDYGGIALGDFRQCVLASMPLDDTIISTLNHRFGRGNLFGINTGNILIRSFLDQHKDEREGILHLHELLGLKNRVFPVSYDFAKLYAVLSNGRVLGDQQQIAEHLSFAEASIKKLYLEPAAKIGKDAREAIVNADYLIFAPGHFFTSVLPHLYVNGFSAAWKKSKAKKIWCVNLLAHRGQDSYYGLREYLGWFENALGRKPFDMLVINESIDKKVLDLVRDRFEKTKIEEADMAYLKKKDVEVVIADLVSSQLRNQQKNDTVMRAPLRHDPKKIRIFFEKDIFALRKR